MKYTWEPEDIWAGRYFWKPHPINKNDVGYTMTVCHQIGYCGECRSREKNEKLYCYVAFLTDGYIYGHEPAEKMAEELTKSGYAPLEGDQLIKILKIYYAGRLK